MTSFWLCCVIVSFCYGTAQLQIVLAGKEELGPKAFGDWKDVADFQGNVDTWDYRNNKLITGIRAGGGASWFFTPALDNIPKTSYLDVEASCTNNPFQLEIYGTSDSPSKNLESIQNVTFDKQSLNTATINKSYRYLRILVRATSQTTFTIHSIKMYHYYCENRRIHNTVLSQVDSSTANISVIVQCGDNAVASDGNSTNITANCTPKGNWTVGDQKCVCVKGFESNNQECSRCLKGHYKSKISNEECTSCPARSTSSSTNTVCNCLEEKYRLKNETGVSSAPCYGFPSKVRNIKVEKSDSRGTITLSWEPPLERGGLPRSLKYDVGCDACELTFTPSKVNLTKTTVEISGLTPGREYNFTVFSKNIISVLYSNGHFAFENKTFKLPRALPEIREKPRTKLIAYGVELSWTAPKNNLNETIVYNVTCFIRVRSICNIPCQNETYDPGSNNLRQTLVTVSNLIAGEHYVFRVYVSVKDVVPEGEWCYIETDRVQVTSDSVKETTDSTDDSGIIINYIIIATTVAGVFLSIIIVLLVKYKRLKRALRLSTHVDIPLGAVETPQESLPVNQEEPGYETVSTVVREFHDDVDTNANNFENTSADGHYAEVGVPSVRVHKKLGNKTPGQIEAHKEPKMSQENPGYAELDKNRLRSRNADDGTYQKLQWRDSDLIPAHERRESNEDIKMGRNLPDYEELDQNKREADNYTQLTKNGEKPELA